jgi:hypothetical protein
LLLRWAPPWPFSSLVMPIRLNLLAELQAQEESRRRDPVKRVIWGGVLGVVIVLGWSSTLQLRALMVKNETNRLEAQVAARTNDYRQFLENQSQLNDVRRKLAALHQLATNRFLQAPVLNALQHAVVDNVQLTRFRTDQIYAFTEETRGTTNSDRTVTPGRPATATEKVAVVLDAKDSGPSPGDQITLLKKALAAEEHFKAILGRTNEVRLASLSPPTTTLGGKPFVLFTLECRLPDRTR